MRTILLSVLGLLACVPAAQACSCMQWTPEQAAEATGVAYVGRVVATPGMTRVAGGPDGKLYEREVEVVVSDPILGVTEGQDLHLTVLVGPSASCGVEYPFSVGDEWLFFTAGDYRITLCAPDRPATRGDVLELRGRYPR